MTEDRCPWTIRWTFNTDAQCELPVHVTDVNVTPEPGGRFSVTFRAPPGQPEEHTALIGPAKATVLNWSPGDRREFTGTWPGPCRKAGDCTLHTGHHGRCAP